jgi:phosphoribosylaminoimidazolecarboxamide formyltransferase/IMP cyclohydrolase
LELRDLSDQPVVRSIDGGFLIQDEDCGLDTKFDCVAQGPSKPSSELLHFGSMVTKHLKSNAIALVQSDEKGVRLLGAGMGNPNRLVSTEQAIAKAKENGIQDFGKAVLISDAFFPFRDNVDLANKFGIKALVQPGGSIRDEEVIEACNEHGMTMFFTGRRHFRH